MCGITGILSQTPVEEAEVQTLCATLRHRGPDEGGVMVAQKDGLWAGLGMTRLSIIDLSTGHQPMHSPCGQVSLVFNGEIYNYRELKAQLAHLPFRTTSDTEVILNGYLAWGEDVFRRLNGMFAVALWDGREGCAWLVRDPIGVKPFYYHTQPGRLTFSSELKTLTQTGLARQACPAGVTQYLSSGYVFHPHTALKDVRQLPPGQWLKITRDLAAAPAPYGGLPRRTLTPGKTEEDWLALLREALVQAVVRQTVSDVPVGLLLSSGVDSMLLAGALKARNLHHQLATFTLTYEEESFNEGHPVRQVCQRWGMTNHQLTLSAQDALGLLPKVAFFMDNLDFLPTCVALYAISKLAGSHGKVVLAGNGGDELFLGYPTHRATWLLGRLGPLRALGTLALPLTRLLPGGDGYLTPREKAQRFLRACGHPPPLAHALWRNALAFGELEALLAPGWRPVATAALMQPQTRYYAEAAAQGYEGLERFMYQDLKTWLVDHGLSLWDKAGMAASLEIRVPLLDLELMDLLMQIPPDLRLKGLGHKGLLRRVAQGLVPPDILALPKHGFQVPVSAWLRGPLKEPFREYTAALPKEVFNAAAVQTLWREFETRRADHSLKLWLLGMLSLWSEAHGISWRG